uniref:KRAB domain-containing protein n=2 Tax=Sus scrofa TaxID=9823 RepID=A0A8D0KKB6_PIG
HTRQKLCRDVMLEMERNPVSLGLVSKPDLVTFLQMKDPWSVNGKEKIAGKCEW